MKAVGHAGQSESVVLGRRCRGLGHRAPRKPCTAVSFGRKDPVRQD